MEHITLHSAHSCVRETSTFRQCKPRGLKYTNGVEFTSVSALARQSRKRWLEAVQTVGGTAAMIACDAPAIRPPLNNTCRPGVCCNFSSVPAMSSRNPEPRPEYRPRFMVNESSMYLQKVFDSGARAYRVRYAVVNILRDRVVNEGAFKNCLEMEDADEVIRAILRRGLKNPKLRAALETTHIVDLNHWLSSYPEFAEAYYAPEQSSLFEQKSPGRRRKRR